jgi:hypothetical protein
MWAVFARQPKSQSAGRIDVVMNIKEPIFRDRGIKQFVY